MLYENQSIHHSQNKSPQISQNDHKYIYNLLTLLYKYQIIETVLDNGKPKSIYQFLNWYISNTT